MSTHASRTSPETSSTTYTSVSHRACALYRLAVTATTKIAVDRDSDRLAAVRLARAGQVQRHDPSSHTQWKVLPSRSTSAVLHTQSRRCCGALNEKLTSDDAHRMLGRDLRILGREVLPHCYRTEPASVVLH